MMVEEPKNMGRVAGAILAGSALTLSSFAIGLPAAYAQTTEPTTSPTATTSESPSSTPTVSAPESESASPQDKDQEKTEDSDNDKEEAQSEENSPEVSQENTQSRLSQTQAQTPATTEESKVSEEDLTSGDADKSIEPLLSINPEQIALEDFVGEDGEEDIGVVHEIVGLESVATIKYSVTGPEGAQPYGASEDVDENGRVVFTIQGYETSMPEVYVGEYKTIVTFEDDEGEDTTLEESFEVFDDQEGGDDKDQGKIVDEGPEIELNLQQVRAGETLTVTGSGFSSNSDVRFELNPVLDVVQSNAEGEINAEVAIPEDLEPGTYDFTAVDVKTKEHASQELEVLDALVEPALVIDPETITLDKFIGDPEDGAGVEHLIQGMQPGSELSFVVSGPEGVSDYEPEPATVDEDGIVDFVIYGYEVAHPEVYLGEYVTVVTYENVDGEVAELTGSFTVITGDGDTPAAAHGDDDAAVPAVATPVDMNGTGLAQTGASSGQLGLLAGALLLVGGAFVAFANRARLFGRKH